MRKRLAALAVASILVVPAAAEAATASDTPVGASASQTSTKTLKSALRKDVKRALKGVRKLDLATVASKGFTLKGTIRINGTMTINPDGTFALNDTYSESGYREKFEFAGKLVGPSSASGTFKLAIEIDGFVFGTLHCQSGSTPMTWNAS